MRSILLWLKLSVVAVSIMAVPAQAQVCKKKKGIKKVVKTSKKVAKKATKGSKKFFSATKGIANTGFNKLEDFDVADLKVGVKFAEKQYKAAKKKLAKWSQAALNKMFKNGFTRELKKKAKLAKALLKATPAVSKQAFAIATALDKGEMSKVETIMKALVKHPKLQSAIKAARRDFGTSLMVGFVASVGASASKGISGGAGFTGIIGTTISLDDNPKVLMQNFFAGGAGVQLGASSSVGGSGGIDNGVVIGFVKGKATNVKGTCFDGGAAISIGSYTGAFGMCFPLDFSKPLGKGFGAPSIFSLAVTRTVFDFNPSDELSISGGITAGMSHTVGLGKLKNR